MDVNVGTITKTVKIPKVVIVMEEEDDEVSYIDVDMPDGDDADVEERTIMVEAEVTDTEHTIDIRKIFASGEKLFVVAELSKTEKSIGDKKMRVSDQVVLNVPNMDVKYYIVGEKPDRIFNSKYTYVSDMSELEADMNDYSVIYQQ
ncbi:hypothetical protein [Maribacter sp. 4U21]|uniref:hypothetical protein n=1 Tax=Maribacter sp. 4U21 TaxID=1889779 RepID=UPI00211E861D|nr:hypothetical protein [Maribacter sp. 4U21]